MAVPTYSEIEVIALDDLVANVATDSPIATGVTNEAGRFINDAYATIWELTGGRIRKIASEAAWTGAQRGRGFLHGIPTDIAEILQVFATASGPASVATCVTANGSPNVSVTAGAPFAAVVPGMIVSGTGIDTFTYVVDVAATFDSLVLSRNATATTNPVTLTFSYTEGPYKLDPAPLEMVLSRKRGSLSYASPMLYHAIRNASPGSTDVGKWAMHYFPGVAGFYFPIWYAPQFVPMSSTITTPDVNDLEGRDIGHLAALYLVNHAGRSDLAEGIAMKLSQNTKLALDRKFGAAADARADAA